MKRTSILFAVAILLAILVAPTFAQDGTRQSITPANASQLAQLIRLGRGSTEHVAFSPDGSTIAVGGTVGVWLYSADALNTEAEPPLLIIGEPVSALAFNPDGSTLVVAGNRKLTRWDVASQSLQQTVDITTRYLAFSPDGSILALNGVERYSVGLADVATTSLNTELMGHTSNISEVAFSPDGSMLASAGEDNTVRLWNVNDGSEIAVLEGHTARVLSVDFSPDATQIVSSASDGIVRTWDVVNAAELQVFQVEGSFGSVASVEYSPDGSLIAAGHSNGILRLWDAAAGTETAAIETEGGEILDLDFSPDGGQIVTVGRGYVAKLWDVAGGTEVAATVGHTDRMNSVAFSPDSGTLMAGSSGGWIWLWDTVAVEELHLNPVIEDATGAAAQNVTYTQFAPDGTMAGTIDGFAIRLWDPATGAPIAELEGDGLTSSMAFSPDSSLVVYVGSDGVYVFDVAAQQMVASFTDHTQWVKTVAFSPDQTMLATGADDGTVRVWAIP